MSERWQCAILVFVSIGAALALSGWVLRRTRTNRGRPWVTRIVAICIALAGVWWSEVAAAQALRQHEESLVALAPTYVKSLREHGVLAISPGTSGDDPTYLSLIDQQKVWQAINPQIGDLYVLSPAAVGYVNLIDSETDFNRDGRFEGAREARVAIGTPFSRDSQEVARAFVGDRVFVTGIRADSTGRWITAYQPIHNESGAIPLVLGLDFPAQPLEAAVAGARRTVVFSTIGTCVLVVGGITFSTAIRGMIRAERARASAMAYASRAKSEFIARMSHEIRTPMSSILGFAEVLTDPDFPEFERSSALEAIRRQGAHVLDLIGEVLDVSKIEAGRMSVERVACNPEAIVGDVYSMLRSRAGEKALELRVEKHPPLPQAITADPLRLRQVMINLVGNAIKFTDRGSVTIRVSHDESTSRLFIEVIDTGPGLAPGQADKLFRPYAQVGDGESRAKGTGLGLFISKNFVELMGGSIALHSEPGQGCTARIVLPVATPALSEQRGASTPGTSGGPESRPASLRGTILLAEDSPDSQRLLTFILEKAGAKVEVVAHGPTVLERALAMHEAGRPYDLILLDMQLPDMDGYQIARSLRSAGYRGSVVASTASAMVGDREKCLDAGCDDYVSKPVDRAMLVSTCASYMNRRLGTQVA